MEPPPLATCVLCGHSFNSDDVIQLRGQTVCAACKPRYIQMMRENASVYDAAAASGFRPAISRHRKWVVCGVDATFPERCIKCNAPAARMFTRKITWYPPWVLFLILVNILVFAIVASIKRKSARVGIGLCAVHIKQRRRYAYVAGGLFSLSLLLVGVAVVLEQELWAIAAIPLAIAAIVVAVIRGGLVSARKIIENQAWVAGAKDAFLQALPECGDAP